MESPTSQSVPWVELIKAEDTLSPSLKSDYEKTVQQVERFFPPALAGILPENVLEIEKAIAAIDAEVAGGIPSYAYFVRLLRKIQVLLVEKAPDFFATLPPAIKGKILDAKIRMPTENEVESEIFIPMNKPSGAFGGSFTFDTMVMYVLNYNDLSKKLGTAFYEYKTEFANRNKKAS